jgi:hypothetical protein
MIGILTGFLGVAAVSAWAVAAWSAIALIGLAPKGQRLATYRNLGWWRHREIVSAIGPAAGPHVARYRKAFMAFFGLLLCAIAISFLALAVVENGGGA